MTLPLRIRYQTIEVGNIDIHLCTLRDRQQFSDPDSAARDLGISSASWPIFGVVWPSSLVLAHYMLDCNIEGRRILEIGCGMALSSLLLNKQLADITATDYHPEVEHFLARNTLLNNGKSIAFERVDWADDRSELGCFDVIIGSDLLYEDKHVSLLADFIQNHANPQCKVIIVDPGRGRKSRLSSQMSGYGFAGSHVQPIQTDYLERKFKGYILEFYREG
ncbi:MAG: methyltransferase domain-containing protein [Candidatus Electrothrix sp. LOE2]|jgi:predicted nicotinamide N-methyase|nr:methyltransferase domain-containing protein [Candidatus Electrothrix sp. LOE2]